MRVAIVLLIPFILLYSCMKSDPKIKHDIDIDTTAVIDDRVFDSTKVLIAELPIKFDSTDVLVFAISLVDLKDGAYSKFRSGSYSSSDIASSYFNGDGFNGDFINVIFQDSNGKRKLTNTKLSIRRGEFLRDIYNVTKQGYILYTIYDRDTNGDSKFNSNDIEALYISNVDGTNFTKLTKELHEFYDYQIIKNDNKIYFRTLEDVNKDGVLNNKDKFHYFIIEFIGDNFSIQKYRPLSIFG